MSKGNRFVAALASFNMMLGQITGALEVTNNALAAFLVFGALAWLGITINFAVGGDL